MIDKINQICMPNMSISILFNYEVKGLIPIITFGVILAVKKLKSILVAKAAER